jgi:hypothetical protein
MKVGCVVVKFGPVRELDLHLYTYTHKGFGPRIEWNDCMEMVSDSERNPKYRIAEVIH